MKKIFPLLLLSLLVTQGCMHMFIDVEEDKKTVEDEWNYPSPVTISDPSTTTMYFWKGGSDSTPSPGTSYSKDVEIQEICVNISQSSGSALPIIALCVNGTASPMVINNIPAQTIGNFCTTSSPQTVSSGTNIALYISQTGGTTGWSVSVNKATIKYQEK